MKVILKECKIYDEDKILAILKHAIEKLDSDKLRKAKNILIKPNLLAGKKPESAITTHPAVVNAIINLIKHYNESANIYVGDSPAVESPRRVFRLSGYEHRIKGAQLYPFDRGVKKIVKTPHICSSFYIADIFEKVDFIISAAKLKTHTQMFYTGGVKNMFGSIVGLEKARMHYRYPDRDKFALMLIDLYNTITPDLTIMDGIVSMEGNGPNNGNPKHTGFLMVSDNAMALDFVALDIMGIDPYTIPQIKNYAKLNNGFFDNIELYGDKIEKKNFKMPDSMMGIASFFRLPSPIVRFISSQIVARPLIEYNKCIACGKCYNICPASPKAIEKYKGKYKINKNNCIKCYCCHEVCPADAIKLKTGLIGKIFSKSRYE